MTTDRAGMAPAEPMPLADFGDDERSQWAAVMRRYDRPLRAFFLARARNPSDVDDLVQEVFVQLLRRGGGAPIEHVQHYLFQVASNVLCDQGRRMKARRHDQHEAYDEGVHAVDAEVSLERIVIGEESLARVIAALKALPQRTQDVFFLRGIRQRKHAEVARLLGISTRNVQKHMTRALKHLGAVMKGTE